MGCSGNSFITNMTHGPDKTNDVSALCYGSFLGLTLYVNMRDAQLVRTYSVELVNMPDAVAAATITMNANKAAAEKARQAELNKAKQNKPAFSMESAPSGKCMTQLATSIGRKPIAPESPILSLMKRLLIIRPYVTRAAFAGANSYTVPLPRWPYRVWRVQDGVVVLPGRADPLDEWFRLSAFKRYLLQWV